MNDSPGDPTRTETPEAEEKKPKDRKHAKRAANGQFARADESAPPGKKERKKKTRPEKTEGDTGSRRVRGKRRQDLNQSLVFELRTLRASLAHTLEAIELRLGGRITELLHAIEGDPGLDQKPRPLTVKAAQAALEEINDLRIKPKRGRIKDVRRIDATIRALRDHQPRM